MSNWSASIFDSDLYTNIKVILHVKLSWRPTTVTCNKSCGCTCGSGFSAALNIPYMVNMPSAPSSCACLAITVSKAKPDSSCNTLFVSVKKETAVLSNRPLSIISTHELFVPRLAAHHRRTLSKSSRMQPRKLLFCRHHRMCSCKWCYSASTIERAI